MSSLLKYTSLLRNILRKALTCADILRPEGKIKYMFLSSLMEGPNFLHSVIEKAFLMQILSKSYQSKRDNVFLPQMTLHAVLNSQLTQYLGLGSRETTMAQMWFLVLAQPCTHSTSSCYRKKGTPSFPSPLLLFSSQINTQYICCLFNHCYVQW